MSAYPARYESDIVLRDGSTLQLRPIRPEDFEGLLELHRRLSPQSIYFRFFAPIRELSRQRAIELATVDYKDSFALVGELAGRLVAVARYYRDKETSDHAEVSFVTEDALQGKGIASRMLERLAEIARQQGINKFEAYVLGDNRKMMDVFIKSGFEVQRRMEGGVFYITFPINPTLESEERSLARAQVAAAASMKAFFEPKTIAVVGAGRRRGKIGAEIMHNLLATDFQGRVYPVNESADTIGAMRAYPRVTDIPDEIDLAILVVPAEDIEAVVDDCIEKKVRGIVIISAGFAESGAEGRTRESAILEKVRRAGVRLVGPNCMGIINTDPNVFLNATFSPVYPPAGHVAMSTQSGALGLAILDYARRLNLGISTFVSVGNKADVSSNDLIQYWADDERTDVILLYVESFGNPRNFARIARRVGRTKPIVAVKSGRSEAGARAATSHSGALAATESAIRALFRQAGVIRTDTLEELFDAANLLAHQPVPNGRRVAILTNAGGPAILAADACESNGLELPMLSDQTVAELRSVLPQAASVANPVNMTSSATSEQYESAMRALLKDETVDSVIVIFIPPLITAPDEVAAAIVKAAAECDDKPVLANFLSAEGAPPILSSIPSYKFPEAAAVALGRVTAYGEWRRRPQGTIPIFDDINKDKARAVVDGVIERGGGWLNPLEIKRLLNAVGIHLARTRCVQSAAEAARFATEIGFPVALKAIGPNILHRTEVGGINLNLENEDSVRLAYDEMARRIGDDFAGAIVQEMVPGGIEVIVGATLDPTFGPLIVYGSGGILVEMMNDATFRIHPVSDLDVEDMMNEVRGTALLRGYRGAPAADEAALREIILRLSALVEICPEICEMDANPVKVLESGAKIVNARVRVDRLPDPGPMRRIAY
jgi:acetyl coenzyme A synthetase (ADP forming)-like protein